MAWQDMEPSTLARMAVGSIVLTADPAAQSVVDEYWRWSSRAHAMVARQVATIRDHEISVLVNTVAGAPEEPGPALELAELLTAWFVRGGPHACRLGEVIWRTEAGSRLRAHTGQRCASRVTEVGTDELFAAIPKPPTARGRVDATVVIPFRDSAPHGVRIRNLAAVLASLSDQSHPRDRYRIVVVESDAERRWQHLIESACDQYLFARNPGLFNKSWAVNAGVVHAAQPTDAICVLDGDVLVDRDFIERAVRRFRLPGAPVHWPYTEILYADERTSPVAVASRCLQRQAQVDQSQLRGVHVKRTPGGCIWLRSWLFTSIGGLDERLRGWGGEDMDLAWRADLFGGVERHMDGLVHLHHPRAPQRDQDGKPFHNGFHWCTWPVDSRIGDLTKYSEQE